MLGPAMPTPGHDHETTRPAFEAGRRLTRLPWRTYRLRVLGMALAALPVGTVLHELGAGWPAWAWLVFACFIWPQLAFVIATRSRDPFRAELRNFMFDSMLAGSWVPLMHFNLLPSVVLVTVVTADKINSGIRGLWVRSLPALVVAMLLSGWATGFVVSVPSSTLVILACLPIIIIHTLSVSASAYRLVRRVQTQNLALEAITQRDELTGMDSRKHWTERAAARLHEHQASGSAATLLLLDIDHFKAINDRFGHTAGDDVLRMISSQIRAHLGGQGFAGRLGGDEFAIVLDMGHSASEAFAESLRAAIDTLKVPGHTGLECSVSLGLADPPDAGLGLREWIEAADRALYEAKRAGRNQAASNPRSPRRE